MSTIPFLSTYFSQNKDSCIGYPRGPPTGGATELGPGQALLPFYHDGLGAQGLPQARILSVYLSPEEQKPMNTGSTSDTKEF